MPPSARMGTQILAISDKMYRMQIYDILADRGFNDTDTFTQCHETSAPFQSFASLILTFKSSIVSTTVQSFQSILASGVSCSAMSNLRKRCANVRWSSVYAKLQSLSHLTRHEYLMLQARIVMSGHAAGKPSMYLLRTGERETYFWPGHCLEPLEKGIMFFSISLSS